MEGNQINIFADEEKGAAFSDCGKYRFALWRIWNKEKPLVMFIGLNPSTANKDTDDATIRKVRKIAKHNGFGGFYMMNLFDIVSKDPEILKSITGGLANNDSWLRNIKTKCDTVVFAWGNFREAEVRGVFVSQMFEAATCLHINKNGSPKHPLYCKDESQLLSYK